MDAGSSAPALSGRWRDERVLAGRRVEVTPWRSNLIVAGANRLLAGLLRGESGWRGVLYWAVGEGDAAWDGAMPAPRASNVKLTKEIARKALTPADLVYLDAQGNPSSTPTDRLQVKADFTGAELGGGVRTLREFGLFGGNATSAKDSGVMLNQVVHARVDVGAGDTLRRTVQLSFAQGAVVDAPPAAGAGLAVTALDGVGNSYSALLVAAGLGTVGALANVDPTRAVAGIPATTLRDLRAKARSVVSLRLDAGVLAPLAGWTVRAVLDLTPADLATQLGSPSRGVSTYLYVQDRLAILEVALDHAALQQVAVQDLLA